jgi:lysophospholipase L1-like esterase
VNTPLKVVCFGDSITRGTISASYIEMLDRRLSPFGYQFYNAGVNGDLAHNLLERIQAVIHIHPDVVTLLVGTNDVIASLIHVEGWVLRLAKHLPRQPNIKVYQEDLTSLITVLKTRTRARIAVASIPPLGEDLDTISNLRVLVYNTFLERIVNEQQVDYLPVYERLLDYLLRVGELAEEPIGEPYQGSWALTAELAVRRLLFRESFDRFSARVGYRLLTDGVHMNTTGAGLIADTIGEYLLSLHGV